MLLDKRLNFNTSIFAHKILHQEGPLYLQELITWKKTCCLSQEYRVNLPTSKMDLYKCSFSYSAANLWNLLPLSLRSLKDPVKFKSSLAKLSVDDAGH